MAYFKPYIDASGYHYPTYNDIRDDMIDHFRQIYGQDIYLGNDSQDYQMISIFALKIYDTFQAVELDYNNRSPKTAIGTALDALVKINGLTRKKASYSTVQVTLTGEPGTQVIGGVVRDLNNVQWSLPYRVNIGSSGTVTVTATCRKIGAVSATVGSVTGIVTPTKGWISVTNPEQAVLGQPVETDVQLRARQTISVANPSRTVLESTKGAIAAVSGVTRYSVSENDTNLTDSNGIPGHSISAIVEGGNDMDIAKAIYLRKSPGCGTYGTTTVPVLSTENVPTNIKFFRPIYKKVAVQVRVKKLTGYTKEVEAAIINYVKYYLQILAIGQSVYLSSIWAVAARAIADITNPTFSVVEVKLGIAGSNPTVANIPISFNQVAQYNSCTVTAEEV
jgi:uncharacterized phage protein gp47/JayE